ncbi:MAG TPA: HD domain-containing phosphohydrolase [Thermoanaerobaculaceae bacterium]|nr:HD domain-containing phosphohydrolase [Thermoanaerobaculaceae bacterium]
MSHDLLLTAEVANRIRRTHGVVRPGDPVAGSVVVTTERSMEAWGDGDVPDAVWIVIGSGVPVSAHAFLTLPDDCPDAHLESAIAAGLEVLALRRRLADQERETAIAHQRQVDLVRVGIALTGERDIERLLQLILTTARELVNADAGSLYLIEDRNGDRVLRFVLSQNDSVPASMVTTTMPLDKASLAGYVATTGEPVGVDDVRTLPADVPYRFNPSFDLAIGYHTRSVLTGPIATRSGQLIGVLQLINRKLNRHTRILSAEAADAQVRPFDQTDVAVIRALAAQAAVAIENTRLVQEIEQLFESFVRASVVTIEQRDPSTSGHSLRVAHYTTSLARAVEQDPPKSYRGLRFSRDEMTQLRYAALLHDFGKVGVREAVLTKAKKLQPDRLALVQERFRHAARAHEVVMLRRLLEALQQLGRAPTAADLANFEASLRQVKADLDGQLAVVLAANEPSVLEEATAHVLGGLQRHAFVGDDGADIPLLLPEEARALSVPRGSLDEIERREIESHVVHSYQFLLTIPWPKRFADVPRIAYGHHEKLNGRGYPNRLVAEQIPTEVRMMTVSDIYDALTTGDRPYKRAVAPERALVILEEEAQRGFLDPELVKVFAEARIFARPLADAVV